MKSNLRKRTFLALFWGGLQRFSQQGVQVAVQLILARLLGPKAFGLIAIVSVFQVLSQLIVDSGLSKALIQRNNLKQVDISTVFYINIAMGAFMAGLLCLASPWIAAFYNQPELVSLTCFISLTLVISPFGIIQLSLLRRSMDFKTELLTSLPSLILSGLLGISLAFGGIGVWSLAWKLVSMQAIWTLMLWRLGNWRPTFAFSWKSAREMFSYGVNVMGTGLLSQGFVNLSTLFIAKLFPETTLGLYWYAKRLQMYIAESLTGISRLVVFSAFSELQSDPLRLRNAVSQAMQTLMFPHSMLMITAAFVAKPMFSIVLGSAWADSAAFFRIFCVLGLLLPLFSINEQAILALGRSRLSFRLQLFEKALIVLSIAVTYRWGIMAIAWGEVIAALIRFPVRTYFSGRYLQYGLSRQLKDIAPPILLAMTAGLTMLLVHCIFPWDSFVLNYLLAVLCGILAWIAGAFLFRLEAFYTFVRPIRRRIYSHKASRNQEEA